MQKVNLENLINQDIIGKKNKKKLISHSKKVREISIRICEEINKHKEVISIEDIELIEAAALLHDLKKYKNKKDKRKKHNVKCAKYIKKHGSDLLKCNENEKALICLMVRWHKGKGYKNLLNNKKQIRMIEIVRIADKISKIYKKPLEDVYSDIIWKILKLQNKRVKNAALKVFIIEVFNQ